MPPLYVVYLFIIAAHTNYVLLTSPISKMALPMRTMSLLPVSEPVCFGRYRDTRNVKSKIIRKLRKFKHVYHCGRYYQLSIELKRKLDGKSIANFVNKNTIFPHKIIIVHLPDLPFLCYIYLLSNLPPLCCLLVYSCCCTPIMH